MNAGGYSWTRRAINRGAGARWKPAATRPRRERTTEGNGRRRAPLLVDRHRAEAAAVFEGHLPQLGFALQLAGLVAVAAGAVEGLALPGLLDRQPLRAAGEPADEFIHLGQQAVGGGFRLHADGIVPRRRSEVARENLDAAAPAALRRAASPIVDRMVDG